MKKVLMIIGGIVLAIAAIAAIIIGITYTTSKKMVCKSNEGNIIIMYNDKKITGYTAKGITYDLDGQQKLSEQIGIDEYLNQFSNWFSTNTTGTCKR